MRIGYNTNGFAHHALLDAIDVLAELGYESVAITLDHGALHPFSTSLPSEVEQVRERLKRYGMHSVVETGARFLLDPRTKHEPTLVSREEVGRQRRIDFLKRATDLAAALGSDAVSLWSGIVRDQVPREEAWKRLTEGLLPVLEHAERRGVPVGFEPEPGMWIDTMDQFDQLMERVPHPRLQLTLDVGHLHCLGEVPIAESIRRWQDRIVNVHVEDMRAGVHEHLRFGQGEIDFAPIFAAFREIGYRGGLHVELSRDSHAAPLVAAESLAFLRKLLPR